MNDSWIMMLVAGIAIGMIIGATIAYESIPTLTLQCPDPIINECPEINCTQEIRNMRSQYKEYYDAFYD